MNISDWLPMSPMDGPPLPKFLDIKWPWIPPTSLYKGILGITIAGVALPLADFYFSGSWHDYTKKTTVQVPQNQTVYFGPSWSNTGTVDMIGHVTLEVNKPDGTVETPDAYLNQDHVMPAGHLGDAIAVAFNSFVTDQTGMYNLVVKLYSKEDGFLQDNRTWQIIVS
jgi:hypothetical protein